MKQITLSDTFFASGTDLTEFETLIKELIKCTHFIKLKGDQLGFLYKQDSPVVKQAYKTIGFSPFTLEAYEEAMSLYNSICSNGKVPSLSSCELSYKKFNKSLADESFNSTGFILLMEGAPLYIANDATSMLCRRAGISGENTGKISYFLTMAICEALGKSKENHTLVIRKLPDEDGRMNNKVFAFLSDKYTEISMELLPTVTKNLISDGKFGNAKVKRWFIDHNFTEIHIEFPEAGEDFSDLSGLSEYVIPGLMMMTSDTGSSSLIIRGTYRVPGKDRYVIMDEYAHKHSGKITTETILNVCDENIMSNFRKLPEALAEKMGRLIYSGSLVTEKDKKNNLAAVTEALKNGMKILGLKKDLGLHRSKNLLDQMTAGLDAAVIYSEYDIAMLFLGLPDRIDGISRDMQTRIAKDCGKAPFVSYTETKSKKTEDEDIVLLPEE